MAFTSRNNCLETLTLVEFNRGSVVTDGAPPSRKKRKSTDLTVKTALDQLRQQQGDSWKWFDPPFLYEGQRARIEVEVGRNALESGITNRQSVLFFLQILYFDGLGFVYRLNPSDTAYQLGFRNEDEILSINGMSVTGWDPVYVEQLLKFLVGENKSFNLVIKREAEESFIYDVKLNLADSECIIEERTNGLVFRKDLEVLSESSTQRECYLMHKDTGLCVVSDGENIRLETLHYDQHVTSAWQYVGNENDRASLHYNKERLNVYSFKLKHGKGDVSKCLGAASNRDDLILMDADIPPHPQILKTKIDNRFFYCTSFPCQCMIFESTIFEEHYLAVRTVENSNKTTLFLKHCPMKNGSPPHDADVIFKCVARTNESLSPEPMESGSNGVSSPVICCH